jgi:hypothetical protein
MAMSGRDAGMFGCGDRRALRLPQPCCDAAADDMRETKNPRRMAGDSMSSDSGVEWL